MCFEMQEKLVDCEDISRGMRRKFSRQSRVSEILFKKTLLRKKKNKFFFQTFEHGIFQVL